MKTGSYPPLAGFILISTLCLLLGGCGIESTLPPPSRSINQTKERAVQISQVRFSDDGVHITCQINSALVSPEISLVLFIEFEGSRIASVPLQNIEFHEFDEFMPDQNGHALCAVEFADAEFASDSVMLNYFSL